MKICVIELTDTEADAVLGDERLGNLRRLMDCGLYGKLESAPGGTLTSFDAASNARISLWQPLASSSRQAMFMRAVESQSESSKPACNSPDNAAETADPAKQWTLLIDQMMNPNWDYIHFVTPMLTNSERVNGDGANGRVTDHSLVLDDQIGRVLEMLDDQTAMLVIGGLSPQDAGPGFFLLAAPACPISGEFENASLADLAPTLLDLAGRSIPDDLPGRSLVAGLEKRLPNEVSAAHERIVLDRLAGLGYV